EPLQFDLEAIQEEAERHRLGCAKLSTGFTRKTSANLTSGDVRSAIAEIYGVAHNEIPVGLFTYYYCLRGALLVINGEHSFEMREGEVLTFEARRPCTFQPLHPVGLKDLAPLLICVEV